MYLGDYTWRWKPIDVNINNKDEKSWTERSKNKDEKYSTWSNGLGPKVQKVEKTAVESEYGRKYW